MIISAVRTPVGRDMGFLKDVPAYDLGAIILDGAEVGRHSIVGRGCIVPPGMKIPDDSLVLGIPAKMVKTLDEKDRQRSEEQLAEAYEKSRKYLKIFGKK